MKNQKMSKETARELLTKLKDDKYRLYILGSSMDEAMDIAINALAPPNPDVASLTNNEKLKFLKIISNIVLPTDSIGESLNRGILYALEQIIKLETVDESTLVIQEKDLPRFKLHPSILRRE